jgi:membrane dipeptidase
MPMPKIHKESVVFDGLIISKWSRKVFEDMLAGGLTTANCCCSVWEGFRATMENIERWKSWIRDYKDILIQVYTTNDIRRAKTEGKVGIILGFQNTSAIEDQLGFISIFKELGIGIMQLTYNTLNYVASGCWESRDGGLSDFGREVVDEMNRVGTLIDLSHVGTKSSEEAITYSKKPVVYSHVCPAGLKNYPRNKTDDQLKFIADKGGLIGACTYPPFLPKGADTSVDDCVDAIEYIINIAGEDSVGIGTDFTQDQPLETFHWWSHDKGSARRVTPGSSYVRPVPMPRGFQTLDERPNLTAAMERRGWSETKIRKVLGGNWLRILKEVWGV